MKSYTSVRVIELDKNETVKVSDKIKVITKNETSKEGTVTTIEEAGINIVKRTFRSAYIPFSDIKTIIKQKTGGVRPGY